MARSRPPLPYLTCERGQGFAKQQPPQPQWWFYVAGDRQRVWASINLPLGVVTTVARWLWRLVPLALWLIRLFCMPDLPDPPSVA